MACQWQTLNLIGPFRKLQRKWDVVNRAPGSYCKEFNCTDPSEFQSAATYQNWVISTRLVSNSENWENIIKLFFLFIRHKQIRSLPKVELHLLSILSPVAWTLRSDTLETWFTFIRYTSICSVPCDPSKANAKDMLLEASLNSTGHCHYEQYTLIAPTLG
jgi:hypothetical protein